MQNVILPDGADLMRAAALTVVEQPAFGVPLQPYVERLVIECVELRTFVRALYAKHGEECPLFKEGE